MIIIYKNDSKYKQRYKNTEIKIWLVAIKMWNEENKKNVYLEK